MMNSAGDMSGKVALITGAASLLGGAVARTLSEAGARILLVDSDASHLESIAAEMRAAGLEAATHATELMGATQCKAAVGAAINAFGRIDALCNVANVFCPAHANDMAEADWERTLAVNLSAPFYLFQGALPHLLDAHGAMVSVASCAAHMAQPFTAAYSASKAAIVQMTKVLAKEFIDQPIRINCVAPGSMAVNSGSSARIPSNVDMSRVLKLTPTRGLIDVTTIADVVAFLASDASTGFHGACVTIDNGISLG
jgi:meso-butanediol dehydrogenase / (S,S)-butanediol dehydrogenase / diacetyl reductase